MKDYYRILDIQFNAHSEDIKRAYRKLALKYHPDKNNNASAEEKFIEIREAYEMLRDEQKRKLYNAMYMAHFMNKARNIHTQQNTSPFQHPPHPNAHTYTQNKAYDPYHHNTNGNAQKTYTQSTPPPQNDQQNSTRSNSNHTQRTYRNAVNWEFHGKYWGIFFALLIITALGWIAISYTAKSTRYFYLEHNGWNFSAMILRNLVILIIGILLQYKGISIFIQKIIHYRNMLKS